MELNTLLKNMGLVDAFSMVVPEIVPVDGDCGTACSASCTDGCSGGCYTTCSPGKT